jgi:hypothetical protein
VSAQIACAQPLPGEQLGVRLGSAPVTGAVLVAARPDLAHVALGGIAPGLRVHQPDLDARQRPTRRVHHGAAAAMIPRAENCYSSGGFAQTQEVVK